MDPARTPALPLTLQAVRTGSPRVRAQATAVVLSVIGEDEGLAYICESNKRINAFAAVFKEYVTRLRDSARDLEGEEEDAVGNILRVFLRMSENPAANGWLREYIETVLLEWADAGKRFPGLVVQLSARAEL